MLDFNNTVASYPQNITIHELFEKQVACIPDNIAVVFNDLHVSYQELSERANKVARMLRLKDIGRDDIVGICVERSVEMIAGIFGIIKAGGAYLPISPSDPSQRIYHMLDNCNAKVLLIQKSLVNLMEFSGETIVIEDALVHSSDNLRNINEPGDLAYVIFTSGSTGKPKGVMIEHRSVINRLNWMQKMYPIEENDTLLQKTPFTFDVSVWEIFWWAITGSKLCLLVPEGEKYPLAIVQAIKTQKISTIHFVPSMLNVFLQYVEDTNKIRSVSSLGRVFSSGEALSVSLVKHFNKTLLKENTTKLTNLYGPTEATVDVSYFDCPEGDHFDRILIGKPIDNINLFVIDNNKIQPVGASGELHISGVGLARGYLNSPELTQKKFVTYVATNDKRLYATGDRARWLNNGNIEFLGRNDNQVKIRGLRIELGEIESTIMDHESIKECVVIVKEYSETVTLLIAHVVGKKLSSNILRDYLKQFLPDYMIPHLFLFIEHIPLMTNGKVDRKALPDPTFDY